MIKSRHLLAVFALGLLSIASCKKDVDDDPCDGVNNNVTVETYISDEALAFLPYQEGQELIFVDSIGDTLILTVTAVSNDSTEDFFEDLTYQCPGTTTTRSNTRSVLMESNPPGINVAFSQRYNRIDVNVAIQTFAPIDTDLDLPRSEYENQPEDQQPEFYPNLSRFGQSHADVYVFNDPTTNALIAMNDAGGLIYLESRSNAILLRMMLVNE